MTPLSQDRPRDGMVEMPTPSGREQTLLWAQKSRNQKLAFLALPSRSQRPNARPIWFAVTTGQPSKPGSVGPISAATVERRRG